MERLQRGRERKQKAGRLITVHSMHGCQIFRKSIRKDRKREGDGGETEREDERERERKRGRERGRQRERERETHSW